MLFSCDLSLLHFHHLWYYLPWHFFQNWADAGTMPLNLQNYEINNLYKVTCLRHFVTVTKNRQIYHASRTNWLLLFPYNCLWFLCLYFSCSCGWTFNTDVPIALCNDNSSYTNVSSFLFNSHTELFKHYCGSQFSLTYVLSVSCGPKSLLLSPFPLV